jgi:hypothetical protein
VTPLINSALSATGGAVPTPTGNPTLPSGSTTADNGLSAQASAEASGGGGGVEIGGFSGAYSENWWDRCWYVLKHPKEFRKERIWYRCREWAKLHERKKHSRHANR